MFDSSHHYIIVGTLGTTRVENKITLRNSANSENVQKIHFKSTYEIIYVYRVYWARQIKQKQ